MAPQCDASPMNDDWIEREDGAPLPHTRKAPDRRMHFVHPRFPRRSYAKAGPPVCLLVITPHDNKENKPAFDKKAITLRRA